MFLRSQNEERIKQLTEEHNEHAAVVRAELQRSNELRQKEVSIIRIHTAIWVLYRYIHKKVNVKDKIEYLVIIKERGTSKYFNQLITPERIVTFLITK